MSGSTEKSLISAFLIIMIVSALVFAGSMPVSKAQIHEVNGIISSDLTLTKANGPYEFRQVVVSPNATLTIEAGSSVTIGYLQVDGTLIVNGSSENQVYFNEGSITFSSTSSVNSLIENAILFFVSVSISSSMTIKNSFLQGGKGSTLTISSGSPTISSNTINGALDSVSVVSITGGSPTISNNNIISFVDNGLYPDPPPGMNRFGSSFGVYASNVNGASITNNIFYLPFRNTSVLVASGTATVEGNTEYPNNSIPHPTPTPPPPPPNSFTDDFENGILYNWTLSINSRLTTEQKHSGNYSLSTFGGKGVLSKQFNAPQNTVYVDVWSYVDNFESQNKILFYTSSQQVELALPSSLMHLYWQCYNGSKWIDIAPFKANIWQHLIVSVDGSNGEVNYTIDGNQTNITLNSGFTVSGFELQSNNINGTSFYDDVSVSTNIPVPPSPTLSPTLPPTPSDYTPTLISPLIAGILIVAAISVGSGLFVYFKKRKH